MNEDMRGLFFIIKGQYRKGVEPSFLNKVSNETSYIGGYDPHSDTTEEWYMCFDSKTFQCTACGGDLKKVAHSVYTMIKKYKDLKHYLRHVSLVTSDDTYEVEYLGHRPLTPEQRSKKAEGRCPRTSPIMRCLYENIYSEYGDYFNDLVEEMEDLAYSELKEDKPIRKTQKLVSKHKKSLVKMDTPAPVKKEVDTTPKKLVKKNKPKVKLGIKKLQMN